MKRVLLGLMPLAAWGLLACGGDSFEAAGAGGASAGGATATGGGTAGAATGGTATGGTDSGASGSEPGGGAGPGGGSGSDQTAPEVVSVEPANGAIGVRSDAKIRIVFSEPMDKVSTQLAFNSLQLAGTTTFDWEDAKTLVVAPSKPLPIAEGDPSVPAIEVKYRLTLVAADVAGNSLVKPYDGAFKTVRRVKTSLKPAPVTWPLPWAGDGVPVDSSGSNENCDAQDITSFVGFVNGSMCRYLMAWSFDGLPVPLELEKAELSCKYESVGAVPFGALGAVIAEQVKFDLPTLASGYSTPAILGFGKLWKSGSVSQTSYGVDITTAVGNELAAKAPGIQLRLRFENDSVKPAAASYLVVSQDKVGGCAPPSLTFLTP